MAVPRRSGTFTKAVSVAILGLQRITLSAFKRVFDALRCCAAPGKRAVSFSAVASPPMLLATAYLRL
jgi:hypothetical protein